VTRQRPKPRTNPANARGSKLRPCAYLPDPLLPDPDDADHPLCQCGLARRHPRHDEPPAAHDRQVEHRRRAGDREEDPE